MTANASLLDSCMTIISGQGILLHSNAHINTAVCLTFNKTAFSRLLLRTKRRAPIKQYTYYIISIVLCF